MSTVDLEMSVKHPFHCIILLSPSLALFICSLDVLNTSTWHIQTVESSTRQNHTQEDYVLFLRTFILQNHLTHLVVIT